MHHSSSLFFFSKEIPKDIVMFCTCTFSHILKILWSVFHVDHIRYKPPSKIWSDYHFPCRLVILWHRSCVHLLLLMYVVLQSLMDVPQRARWCKSTFRCSQDQRSVSLACFQRGGNVYFHYAGVFAWEYLMFDSSQVFFSHSWLELRCNSIAMTV